MLKVIKDTPAFAATSKETNIDAFNHQIFAEILVDLIKDNDPSLTVGLFGGWGVGKTSIVNQFITKAKNQFISPIYFNAWKYSGDSFRRQLLLSLAGSEKIIKDEKARVQKIEELQKLNYADLLRKETPVIKVDKFALLNLLIFVVLIIGGVFLVVFGGKNSNISLISAGIVAFVGSLIPIIINQVQQTIKVSVDRVVDPKLIFPEQFAERFQELIANGKKEFPKNSIVIIIDDLDRCDVDTIKNILVTLKTFLDTSDCFFIIPLDDASIIKMFETKQNLNFGYEQLRKYFNVFVRIPEINNHDIIAFAEQIAQDYNIDNDVALIATLGDCSDARKMKHFLNLFKVKEEIANQRIKAGLMGSLTLGTIKLPLAKISVLEYQYPEIFRVVSLHPAILEQLTSTALNDVMATELNIKMIDKKADKIEDIWNKYNGLKDFLIKTNEIDIGDVELISRLKVSNFEGTFTDSITSIRENILYGKHVDIEKLLKNEKILSNKDMIAKVIQQYFDKDIDIVKDKAAEFGLKIISENLLDEPNKTLLTISISKVLVRKGCKVTIDNGSVLKILDNFDKFQRGLKILISQKIINDVFKATKINFEFSDILIHPNYSDFISLDDSYKDIIADRLFGWFNSIGDVEKKSLFYDQILSVLQPNVKLDHAFPSDNLFEAIINEIPEIENDTKILLNDKINLILFNDNNVGRLEKSNELINKKIRQIFSSNIIDLSFNKTLQNGCYLAIQIPFWLDDQFAIDLSNQLFGNINKFSDSIARQNLLLIFAICYFSINESIAQNKTVLNNYNSLVDKLDLEIFEKHIQGLTDLFGENKDAAETLVVSHMNRKWQKLEQIYSSDYEQSSRIFDTCFKLRAYLASDTVDIFFKTILNNSDPQVISIWQEKIYENFGFIADVSKNDILVLLLEKFGEMNNNAELRKIIFEIFLKLVKTVDHTPFQQQYIDMINSLVDESDIVRLNILAQNFDLMIEIFGEDVPRTRANSLFDSLIAKQDLSKFQLSYPLLLRYEKEFTNYSWQRLGEKIISELLNENLIFDHKKILLEIAVHITHLDEQKKKLSRILFEYKESGTNDVLRSKSWELYESLTRRKVIPKSDREE